VNDMGMIGGDRTEKRGVTVLHLLTMLRTLGKGKKLRFVKDD